MKFEVGRYGLAVIPESRQDEAYIEDTLGLFVDGATIRLVRRNASNLLCIARLETVREEDTDK